MCWVTRVPETLKELQTHYQRLDTGAMLELTPGYKYLAVTSHYAEVPQRWLLIHSQQAAERQMRTFEKTLEKQRDRAAKDLKHLRHQAFRCQEDAEAAAQQFAQGLRHQSFTSTIERRKRYGTKGRPAKDAAPQEVHWLSLIHI